MCVDKMANQPFRSEVVVTILIGVRLFDGVQSFLFLMRNLFIILLVTLFTLREMLVIVINIFVDICC